VGAGVTVAVNVTICPTAAGFREAVSLVLVGVNVNFLMVSINGDEVEVPKPAFPEYTAVML